jgi:hypothetical protein
MGNTDLIIFKPQRIADHNWQVRAFCPGAKIEYIPGFQSEEAAKNWIASSQPQAWANAWGARS